MFDRDRLYQVSQGSGPTVKRLLRALLSLALAFPLIGLAVAGPGAAGAQAEDNGVGLTPALGWSSWSFVRHDPTAAVIEAQAKAMKTSGLAAVGYQYVNVDDFWYTALVIRARTSTNTDAGSPTRPRSRRPPAGRTGSASSRLRAQAGPEVRALRHARHLRPGGVAENTPIEGTSYTADQIADGAGEGNYNCGGMQGINYSKPGAQAVHQLLGGRVRVLGRGLPQARRRRHSATSATCRPGRRLEQTGRPIHLELSNSLDIGSASTWEQYSNGWRTGGDIECYCGTDGSSYPLTDWSNISGRFDQVAAWQPYGEPGAFNDYDSIEVGNGSNDGLTPDERQTQMSLWALGSSPFILGTDLTHLDPTDLSYLKNRAVLAVDQDAIDASRISDTATSQVFAKTEKAGDVIVGLFNTSGSTEAVSTSVSALGLSAGTYKLDDLWTGKSVETAGTVAASIPTHGVALYKVTRAGAASAPPDTVSSVSVPASVQSGQAFTASVSFTNDGTQSVRDARASLVLPTGWTAKATSPTGFIEVETGQTGVVGYTVTPAGATSSPLASEPISARIRYTWSGRAESASTNADTTVADPVQAPSLTYSSATDGPVAYGQSGSDYAIEGAGPDLWTDADAYSTIYQPASVSAGSTIQAEVTAQSGMSGYAKAGIIVRNDMTASGTGTEGVILYESPSGGIQLEWDDNGGTSIDDVTPANGTIADVVPVYLRLVIGAGGLYTGYYSTDGSTWTEVGAATVPDQNATQDAGLFMLSHTAGSDGLVDFSGFGVTD
jgi:hypothetical protein